MRSFITGKDYSLVLWAALGLTGWMVYLLVKDAKQSKIGQSMADSMLGPGT